MHFDALGVFVAFGSFFTAGVLALAVLLFDEDTFTNLLLQLLLVQLPLIIMEPHLQNSDIKFIPSILYTHSIPQKRVFL